MNKETYILEAQDKFTQDNEDLYALYNKYNALSDARDRGEELDDAGADILAGDVPVLPVFNVKEHEDRFDFENPEIVIPN